MVRRPRHAFFRIAQHSLRVLGEVAMRKQRSVDLAPYELAASEFLAKRVSEAETLKISSVSLDTLLVLQMGPAKVKARDVAASVMSSLTRPDGAFSIFRVKCLQTSCESL